MWFVTASVGINLSIEILQGIIWFWGWLLVYIRIIHPLTFRHRVNILLEKPDKENECDFFFIHPVTWSQWVKQRVMRFVTTTEMSLQTTKCTTFVAKEG